MAEAVAGIQSVKAILPVCDKPVHVENDCANNSVAHELAKLGRSIYGSVILDSAPPCVVGLVKS